MKINLRVQYMGEQDKQDSCLLIGQMLTTFADNDKASSITLTIASVVQPYHDDMPRSKFNSEGKWNV